jgi:hypothetical protein
MRFETEYDPIDQVYEEYKKAQLLQEDEGGEEDECPICMDAIESNNNRTTTACGHTFHSNCIMMNISHNGFACPFCRTEMVENPKEDDEDGEDDEYGEDDGYGEDDEYVIYEENERNKQENKAFQEMRLMFQEVQGEKLEESEEEESEEEESEEEESEDEENEDEEIEGEEEIIRLPSATFICDKLKKKGVTMEDLVKALLLDHSQYNYDIELSKSDNKVYGKIKGIIIHHINQSV